MYNRENIKQDVIREGLMDNSRLDKVAVVVSHLLNPALVAWWVFGSLTWLVGGGWIAGMVGVVFYALIPGSILLYMYRAGFVEELYPPERSQRAPLLLLGTACYFLGFIALGLAGVPGLVLGAGCAYCINTLLVWQINRHWKISIHAVGVSGGLMILLLAAGPGLWPLLVALPLVAWARLRLNSHTPAQVAVGALLGGCSTGLLLSLFERL